MAQTYLLGQLMLGILNLEGLLEIVTSWGRMGFPDSSVGKESTCNAGDPGSIPGSGRSPGERKGYSYSWASLVAQLIKNPPAMHETWVRDLSSVPWLGRSPGEGYPFQYSGLENSMESIVHGVTKSWT